MGSSERTTNSSMVEGASPVLGLLVSVGSAVTCLLLAEIWRNFEAPSVTLARARVPTARGMWGHCLLCHPH